MNKPKRVKNLVAPVYGVNLQFICGADLARKMNCPMEDHQAAAVWYDYGDLSVSMVFNDNELTNRNTLAHETLHAAWRILDMVGVKVAADNHEALAYLVGWVAGELDKWALPLAEKLGAADE